MVKNVPEQKDVINNLQKALQEEIAKQTEILSKLTIKLDGLNKVNRAVSNTKDEDKKLALLNALVTLNDKQGGFQQEIVTNQQLAEKYTAKSEEYGQKLKNLKWGTKEHSDKNWVYRQQREDHYSTAKSKIEKIEELTSQIEKLDEAIGELPENQRRVEQKPETLFEQGGVAIRKLISPKERFLNAEEAFKVLDNTANSNHIHYLDAKHLYAGYKATKAANKFYDITLMKSELDVEVYSAKTINDRFAKMLNNVSEHLAERKTISETKLTSFFNSFVNKAGRESNYVSGLSEAHQNSMILKEPGYLKEAFKHELELHFKNKEVAEAHLR
jgi:hypothetical protein